VPRVRVDGGLIIYPPGIPCRELLGSVRRAGLVGDGLELECVSRASVVVGIEISDKSVYGRVFRRAMAKPYPGGLLSISVDAVRRKAIEVLREKTLYKELGKGRGLLWSLRSG
jgi:hypothetical protein